MQRQGSADASVPALSKVIGVFTIMVAENGKSAKGSFDDKLQNRTTAFIAAKQ